LLHQAYEVHAISRSPDKKKLPGVIWHEVDFLKASAEEVLGGIRPSHFLHLAWVTKHKEFWASQDNRIWLKKSCEWFDAFASVGGTRWVSAGTCAEYDWSRPGPYFEGDTSGSPQSLYGECKRDLGHYVQDQSRLRGVSATHGRIFFIYGPGEQREKLVPSVCSAMIKGLPVPATTGQQLRDFIYVDDVARIFSDFLKGSHDGLVNVGTGKGVTVRGFIEIMARVSKSQSNILWGQLPMPNGDPDEIIASVNKLRKGYDLKASTSLELGAQAVVDWLRSGKD
jgi:nucleoside-diphosphate-sugar epimerase